MSEHKYIIRNCPCNVTAEDMCDWENTNETYCQGCTDCVMKQIVELCKEESSIIQHKQRIKVKGLNKLADRIFELLDIQEITDERE